MHIFFLPGPVRTVSLYIVEIVENTTATLVGGSSDHIGSIWRGPNRSLSV